MEVLKNLISCAICRNRLQDPVFLPCGKTVCKWHTRINLDNNVFNCTLCAQSHSIPTNGFTKNEAISNALSDNIDRLVFESPYSEARENVNKLKKTLSDSKQVSDDKFSFVHTFFSNIRNRIDLNEAEFRLMFDEKLSSLRSRVDEYEKECQNNLESGKFENFDDIQKEFDEMNGYLNALHIDPGHWKHMKEKSQERHVEASKRFGDLKEKILLNKSVDFILEHLDFRRMCYKIIDRFDPFLRKQSKETKRQDRLLNRPIHLKSLASGKYLCAEDWGKKPFVANREIATSWETFILVEQENGIVAIKSSINGKFARFEESKSSMSAKSENPSETQNKFEICLSFFDDDLIGIKSCMNRKYLCMPDDQNYPVCFWDGTLSRRSFFRVINNDSNG